MRLSAGDRRAPTAASDLTRARPASFRVFAESDQVDLFIGMGARDAAGPAQISSPSTGGHRVAPPSRRTRRTAAPISAFATTSRLVLGQELVEGKADEFSAIPPLRSTVGRRRRAERRARPHRSHRHQSLKCRKNVGCDPYRVSPRASSHDANLRNLGDVRPFISRRA
jgi:hypothetical protein